MRSDKIDRQLGTRMGIGLGKYLHQDISHRLVANGQLTRNFLIARARRHQARDFALARG
jgi:hypothetical protein